MSAARADNRDANDAKEALVCMSSEDRAGTLEAMSANERRAVLPFQRGPAELTEELQVDMQCFVNVELQSVIFGAFIPILWLLHGFSLYVQLACQLWLLTQGSEQKERMVTQGILVSCPMMPIVLMFELGFCFSTMFFMFDLEFNLSVMIGYAVFALLNGAFMTYFMIIRPRTQGYLNKEHKNYRKLDRR